jgi:lipopolysaccharide/colanic/teichoic acid biosynthesis glycosyltransferase
MVKNQNIEIQLSPSLFEFSVSRMKIFEYMSIPLIQIQEITIRGIDKFFKYLIDYSIGIILFFIFTLIYPVIGLLIKLDSKGPILFTQERYGKNFRKIRIYKFRTMRAGADREKEILEKLYDRDKGGDFKLKDDPRITKVGKFLRKTSIDELPQIINVLKGQLSVIGPRALAVPEGDKLKDWEKKRMEINQGITGLWQVSGRSDVDYEERMKLDLYYIQNWSIALELRIIALTILRMFFNMGAY